MRGSQIISPRETSYNGLNTRSTAAGGYDQPSDEVAVNRGSGGNVVCAHEPNGPASNNLGDIELCAGVFWHGPKHGDGDKECV